MGHLTTLYIEHLTTPWPVPGHGPFLHFAPIISGGVIRYSQIEYSSMNDINESGLDNLAVDAFEA